MYDVLASYYSELVDAKTGSDYFYELIQKYGKRNKILDCACGSGELALRLEQENYEVKAFDLSEKMLFDKPKTIFSIQNMTEFTYDETFDTITCFCDSLNYLLTEKEVSSFFQRVYQHLEKNGIFLFDMHIYDTLNYFEEEYYQSGIVGNVAYEWSIIAQEEYLQHTFFFDEKKEIHIQKVYKIETIKELLTKIGFEVILLDDIGEYTQEKVVIKAIKK